MTFSPFNALTLPGIGRIRPVIATCKPAHQEDEDIIKPEKSARRETCLLRKAILKLLAQHPDGLTREEICSTLLRTSGFKGTRRNLDFQAGAILHALVDEKIIASAEGSGSSLFRSIRRDSRS